MKQSKHAKFFDRLMSHMSGNILIFVFVLVFMISSFAIWKFCESYRDIGSNLFAASIQLALTFVFLDRFIKKAIERQMLPRQLAGYEDVRLFVSRLVNLFQSLYQHSVPDIEPTTIEDLFSRQTIDKILRRVDLAKNAPVYPQKTWFVWLPESLVELTKMGDKIMGRNSQTLPPDIYQSIHSINQGSFFSILKHIPNLHRLCQEKKIPRPTVLEAYSVEPSTEDLEAVIHLFKWLEEFYLKHKKQFAGIKRVSEIVPNATRPMPPPSMMSDSEYNQQATIFSDFQKPTSTQSGQSVPPSPKDPKK